MSDFSGEHGFFPDWFWPAVSLLVVAPTALALFMARPWWVGLAMLAAATGVAVLGWWGWGWVRGWRTDRVLRREDDEFALVSTTDHYDISPAQSDKE